MKGPAKEDVVGKGSGKPDFDPAKQVGVTPPMGFFDPIGFSKKGDETGFRYLRAAELKHGRVAMLAFVGELVQRSVRLPGFGGVPNGLAAADSMTGTLGVAALLAVAGLFEMKLWKESSEREPGDFGDPLRFGIYTRDMRDRELMNGRFAMVGVFAMLAREILTGKDAVEQLLQR